VKQVDFEWTPIESRNRSGTRSGGAGHRAPADLADGYAALASIQMNYDWDWAGAETSLRRALELVPDQLDRAPARRRAR
jgi:hypothetical protein